MKKKDINMRDWFKYAWWALSGSDFHLLLSKSGTIGIYSMYYDGPHFFINLGFLCFGWWDSSPYQCTCSVCYRRRKKLKPLEEAFSRSKDSFTKLLGDSPKVYITRAEIQALLLKVYITPAEIRALKLIGLLQNYRIISTFNHVFSDSLLLYWAGNDHFELSRRT